MRSRHSRFFVSFNAWIVIQALVISSVVPAFIRAEETPPSSQTLRVGQRESETGLEEIKKKLHFQSLPPAASAVFSSKSGLEEWEGSIKDLIQSFSGIRAVVGSDILPPVHEPIPPTDLSSENKLIFSRYAYLFALGQIEKLRQAHPPKSNFVFVLGRDPRPSGEAVREAQILGMVAAAHELKVGIEFIDGGVLPTPFVESLVRQVEADGGVIITASHNPLSWNGVKYPTAAKEPEGSLISGGILLPARQMRDIVEKFKQWVNTVSKDPVILKGFIKNLNQIKPDEIILRRIDRQELLDHVVREARQMWNLADDRKFREFREQAKDVKIVVDPNGGAACGYYVDFLHEMGFTVVEINGVIGQPQHLIEPINDPKQGDALANAKRKLIEEFKKDQREGSRFKTYCAIVTDFDADRANFLILDTAAEEVIEPNPQEVAAMNIAMALARRQIVREETKDTRPLAIVVHDAPSGRQEEIAKVFEAKVFVVEVGEVNVLEKMRQLEQKGYDVVIGTEQANGGTVFRGDHNKFQGNTSRDGAGTGLFIAMVTMNSKIGRWWLTRRNASVPENVPIVPVPQSPTLTELLRSLPGETGKGDWHFVTLGDKPGQRGDVPEEGVIPFKEAIERKWQRELWPQLSGPGLALSAGDTLQFSDFRIVHHVETKESEPYGPGISLGEELTKLSPIGVPFGMGGTSIHLTANGKKFALWFRGSLTEGMVRVFAEGQGDRAEDIAQELRSLFVNQLYPIGVKHAKPASGLEEKDLSPRDQWIFLPPAEEIITDLDGTLASASSAVVKSERLERIGYYLGLEKEKKITILSSRALETILRRAPVETILSGIPEAANPLVARKRLIVVGRNGLDQLRWLVRQRLKTEGDSWDRKVREFREMRDGSFQLMKEYPERVGFSLKRIQTALRTFPEGKNLNLRGAPQFKGIPENNRDLQRYQWGDLDVYVMQQDPKVFATVELPRYWDAKRVKQVLEDLRNHLKREMNLLPAEKVEILGTHSVDLFVVSKEDYVAEQKIGRDGVPAEDLRFIDDDPSAVLAVRRLGVPSFYVGPLDDHIIEKMRRGSAGRGMPVLLPKGPAGFDEMLDIEIAKLQALDRLGSWDTVVTQLHRRPKRESLDAALFRLATGGLEETPQSKNDSSVKRDVSFVLSIGATKLGGGLVVGKGVLKSPAAVRPERFTWGQLRRPYSESYVKEHAVDWTVDRIFHLVADKLSRAGIKYGRLKEVGISWGGLVNLEAGTVQNVKIWGFEHPVPLKFLLERQLRPRFGNELTVKLISEDEAASLGELTLPRGVLRGRKNGIIATLGTGFSIKVVHDGKPIDQVPGRIDAHLGEIGWQIIRKPDGSYEYRAQRDGSWPKKLGEGELYAEALLGGPGLAARFVEAIHKAGLQDKNVFGFPVRLLEEDPVFHQPIVPDEKEQEDVLKSVTHWAYSSEDTPIRREARQFLQGTALECALILRTFLDVYKDQPFSKGPILLGLVGSIGEEWGRPPGSRPRRDRPGTPDYFVETLQRELGSAIEVKRSKSSLMHFEREFAFLIHPHAGLEEPQNVEEAIEKWFRMGATEEDQTALRQWLAARGQSVIDEFVQKVAPLFHLNSDKDFGAYFIPHYFDPKKLPDPNQISGNYPIPSSPQEFEAERLRMMAYVVVNRAFGHLRGKPIKVVVNVGIGFVGTAVTIVTADSDRYTAIAYQRPSIASSNKVNLVNEGKMPVDTADKTAPVRLEAAVKRGDLTATFLVESLAVADFVMLETELHFQKVYPHQIDQGKSSPEASLELIRQVGSLMPIDATLLIESTVPPGFTEKEAWPVLTGAMQDPEVRYAGLPLLPEGRQANCAYAFQRLEPGPRWIQSLLEHKRIGAALTAKARKDLEEYFRSVGFHSYEIWSDVSAVEAIKDVENVYRIGLIEVSGGFLRGLERIGANAWVIFAEIAADRPGSHGTIVYAPAIQEGQGYCTPKELGEFVSGLKRDFGVTDLNIKRILQTRIDAVAISDHRAEDYAYWLIGALGKLGLAPVDSRILIAGASYKPGVGDTRWTGAERLIRLLAHFGFFVQATDPFVKFWAEFRRQRLLDPEDWSYHLNHQAWLQNLQLQTVPTLYEAVYPDQHGIVLATRHWQYVGHHQLRFLRNLDPKNPVHRQWKKMFEGIDSVGAEMEGLDPVKVAARMLGLKGRVVIDTFNFLSDEDIKEFLALGWQVLGSGKGHIPHLAEQLTPADRAAVYRRLIPELATLRTTPGFQSHDVDQAIQAAQSELKLQEALAGGSRTGLEESPRLLQARADLHNTQLALRFASANLRPILEAELVLRETQIRYLETAEGVQSHGEIGTLQTEVKTAQAQLDTLAATHRQEVLHDLAQNVVVPAVQKAHAVVEATAHGLFALGNVGLPHLTESKSPEEVAHLAQMLAFLGQRVDGLRYLVDAVVNEILTSEGRARVFAEIARLRARPELAVPSPRVDLAGQVLIPDTIPLFPGTYPVGDDQFGPPYYIRGPDNHLHRAPPRFGATPFNSLTLKMGPDLAEDPKTVPQAWGRVSSEVPLYAAKAVGPGGEKDPVIHGFEAYPGMFDRLPHGLQQWLLRDMLGKGFVPTTMDGKHQGAVGLVMQVNLQTTTPARGRGGLWFDLATRQPYTFTSEDGFEWLLDIKALGPYGGGNPTTLDYNENRVVSGGMMWIQGANGPKMIVVDSRLGQLLGFQEDWSEINNLWVLRGTEAWEKGWCARPVFVLRFQFAGNPNYTLAMVARAVPTNERLGQSYIGQPDYVSHWIGWGTAEMLHYPMSTVHIAPIADNFMTGDGQSRPPYPTDMGSLVWLQNERDPKGALNKYGGWSMQVPLFKFSEMKARNFDNAHGEFLIPWVAGFRERFLESRVGRERIKNRQRFEPLLDPNNTKPKDDPKGYIDELLRALWDYYLPWELLKERLEFGYDPTRESSYTQTSGANYMPEFRATLVKDKEAKEWGIVEPDHLKQINGTGVMRVAIRGKTEERQVTPQQFFDETGKTIDDLRRLPEQAARKFIEDQLDLLETAERLIREEGYPALKFDFTRARGILSEKLAQIKPDQPSYANVYDLSAIYPAKKPQIIPVIANLEQIANEEEPIRTAYVDLKASEATEKRGVENVVIGRRGKPKVAGEQPLESELGIAKEIIVPGTLGEMKAILKRDSKSKTVLITLHGLGGDANNRVAQWIDRTKMNVSTVRYTSSRYQYDVSPDSSIDKIDYSFGQRNTPQAKTFAQEVEDLRRVIRGTIQEFEQTGVSAEKLNIILVGNSLGGQIVPIVAHEFPQVKGVISIVGAMETFSASGIPPESWHNIIKAPPKDEVGAQFSQYAGPTLVITASKDFPRRNASAQEWRQYAGGPMTFVEVDDQHGLVKSETKRVIQTAIRDFVASITAGLEEGKKLGEVVDLNKIQVIDPKNQTATFSKSPVVFVSLDAGRSRRFEKSGGGTVTKVLALLRGIPVGMWAKRSVEETLGWPIVSIVAYQAEQVITEYTRHSKNGIVFVNSVNPTGGTGFALYNAKKVLQDSNQVIVATVGDQPFYNAALFQRAVEKFQGTNPEPDLVIGTIPLEKLEYARGKGRIVRDTQNRVVAIVEQADIDKMVDGARLYGYTREQLNNITEVNGSLYVMRTGQLDTLAELGNQTAQSQYYVTDLIGLILRRDGHIETVRIDSSQRVDITTLQDLRALEQRLSRLEENPTLSQWQHALQDSVTAQSLLSPHYPVDMITEKKIQLLGWIDQLHKLKAPDGTEAFSLDQKTVMTRTPGNVKLPVGGRHLDYIGFMGGSLGFPTRPEVVTFAQVVDGLNGEVEVYVVDAPEPSVLKPFENGPRQFSLDHPWVNPPPSIRTLPQWDAWASEIAKARLQNRSPDKKINYADDIVAALISFLRTDAGDPSGRARSFFEDLKKQRKGLRIAFASDLPTRGGLSSSSAVLEGSAQVLNHLGGIGLDIPRLIQLGYAERFYVGTQGGVKDHAHLLYGSAFIGVSPTQILQELRPIPGTSVVLLDSGIVRDNAPQYSEKLRQPDDDEQNIKGRTGVGYALGALWIRHYRPDLAYRIRPNEDFSNPYGFLRELVPGRPEGLSLADLYHLLKIFPEKGLTREDFYASLPEFQTELDQLFKGRPVPPRPYPLREMVLFGFAEEARNWWAARLFKQLQEGTLDEHTAFHQFMEVAQVAHNGDRIVFHEITQIADGNLRIERKPWEWRVSDEKLDELAAHADEERAALWRQAGWMERSIEPIDQLVDLIGFFNRQHGNDTAVGVIVGAGLGGTVNVLARDEFVQPLLSFLEKHYYQPLGLTHTPHVIAQPGRAASVFTLPSQGVSKAALAGLEENLFVITQQIPAAELTQIAQIIGSALPLPNSLEPALDGESYPISGERMLLKVLQELVRNVDEHVLVDFQSTARITLSLVDKPANNYLTQRRLLIEYEDRNPIPFGKSLRDIAERTEIDKKGNGLPLIRQMTGAIQGGSFAIETTDVNGQRQQYQAVLKDQGLQSEWKNLSPSQGTKITVSLPVGIVSKNSSLLQIADGIRHKLAQGEKPSQETGLEEMERLLIPAEVANRHLVVLTPQTALPGVIAGLGRLRTAAGQGPPLAVIVDNDAQAAEVSVGLEEAGLTLATPIVNLSQTGQTLAQAVVDLQVWIWSRGQEWNLFLLDTLDQLRGLGRFLKIPLVSLRAWVERIRQSVTEVAA